MKLNNKAKMIIGVAVGVLLIGIIVGIVIFSKKGEKEDSPSRTKEKITIVDPNSNSRPYAVMINNIHGARKYQTGLQDAFLVYEIIVEGGITRFEALFQDQDTAKIGSIRSARHYYLDYALENDAIFVHWGTSPQANTDIADLKIDNINGMYHTYAFYRETSMKNAPYEYTGFSNMELIKKGAETRKLRTTSDAPLLLNYKAAEVDLSKIDDAKVANKVSIAYSGSYVTGYTYDAEKKVYLRDVAGTPHTDAQTKEQYTTKNIITYQVKNNLIPGDNKNRQELHNLGEGTGYYISNGYAVPIKWEKKTREGQTKYYYMNGKEIEVNDGNTWIQIQPVGQKLTIS